MGEEEDYVVELEGGGSRAIAVFFAYALWYGVL